MGTPLEDDKRQPMRPAGTFLGLEFDFSQVAEAEASSVAAWVRARLEAKVADILATVEKDSKLRPAQPASMES